MLHVYGDLSLPPTRGWIVARLCAEGHAEAVAAAHIIETGIDRELYAVALTAAHRDAMLRHLGDCPDGLAELHVTLLRDNRIRMTRHRSDAAKPHDRVGAWGGYQILHPCIRA